MEAVPYKVEVEPEGSYQHLFDYSNVALSIETLLDENPGSSVFLYKNRESIAVQMPVQFDVIHALLAPTGTHPPKWLCAAGTMPSDMPDSSHFAYTTFGSRSLSWEDAGKLKCNDDGLLSRWAKEWSGRVHVFVYKGRRLRNNISDEEKAAFTKVKREHCWTIGFSPIMFYPSSVYCLIAEATSRFA